jgi:hypothetical protein
MRNLYVRLLTLLAAGALAAVLHSGAGPAEAAPGLSIEPMVWQFDRDYGAGIPDDNVLPVDTVQIKTHDGTDWMSTYDTSPLAISGPDAVRQSVERYKAQGIDVAAWFVPMGTDYDRQVQMAIEVIDAGVSALYADIEPFDGFCNQECPALAQNFWPRVRAARPDARLGVVYVPLPEWRDVSDTAGWLATADVALPMCYWVDFEGSPPFDDPEGCVRQAKADIDALVGHPLEYMPVLSGDSSWPDFQRAMDAAMSLGSTSVSIWRRGVVHPDVWNVISGYAGRVGPHCAELWLDGCLIRELFQPTTYLIVGGSKLPVSDAALTAFVQDPRDVQIVHVGVLGTFPNVPVDGTLLRELGAMTTYVVYGGAKFAIEDEATFLALGLDPAGVRPVPVGSTAWIPDVPSGVVRLKPLEDRVQYIVQGGARIPLDSSADRTLAAQGRAGLPTYLVPDSALAEIPLADLIGGDVDCNDIVDAIDVAQLMARSSGAPSGALCRNISGDVNCDDQVDATDALAILRHLSDSNGTALGGCSRIGVPRPAQLIKPVLDAFRSTPTPTATPTPTPTGTATPTPSPTPEFETQLRPVPTPQPTAEPTPSGR